MRKLTTSVFDELSDLSDLEVEGHALLQHGWL